MEQKDFARRNFMKEFYTLTVAGLERNLPICPLNENLYIAGFVIFGDPELTVACAAELLARAPEYDYLITAESKGIPLVHEMARQHGDAKYFVARKHSKLYMRNVFSVEVKSISTSNAQALCLDGADAELIRGKRILIADDVISTGGSLRALEALVTKAGGTVCGKMAILAEGDAIPRTDIVYLEPLPLFDKNGDPIAR
jgi:adenine phosphoribosyltransferase